MFNKEIKKCDCGHYEYESLIVTQLGKTNCRICANKINRKLSNIFKNVMKEKPITKKGNNERK